MNTQGKMVVVVVAGEGTVKSPQYQKRFWACICIDLSYIFFVSVLVGLERGRPISNLVAGLVVDDVGVEIATRLVSVTLGQRRHRRQRQHRPQ